METAIMGLLKFWRLFTLLIFAIFLFLASCFCLNAEDYKFMHQATSGPNISYYEYIIIGGGTAGCPLAATLSQNSTVLLLERGASPFGNPNITNLSEFGATFSDTSSSSPSQRFISEDGVFNTRARVLGGGSCINAGFYSRASTQYVTTVGWEGKLVNESYEWVEKKVVFKPAMKQWQTAVKEGLLEAGVVPDNGFTYDHINGTKVSGTIFDENGYRHSAAQLLQYANLNSLTVLLHATVHKILFTTIQGTSRLKARGVVFRDASGVKHIAYLKSGSKNEIILSAGALGSPQLLLLSGIGPDQHLKAHNITTVLDQPLVGQDMSDSPMNAVFIPSPLPVEVNLPQIVGITRYGSYIEAVSGLNFLNITDSNRDYRMFSAKKEKHSTLPPKQKTSEALSKGIDDMSKLDDATFQGGFIVEKVTGPLSTGHLELKNKNPIENPPVTFNYFKEPEDLQRCVDGLKVIEKIIESKAFSNFTYNYIPFSVLLNIIASSPVNLLPRHSNDTSSLEQFCKDTVITMWHYQGGCQVDKVVDQDYKVVGVDDLRVIDGSTFTYSPGTNPQATVMMLGRYMGVKILNERLAGEKSH